MDGTYLTEMRTAAVSAAATRRLAADDRARARDPRQRRAGTQPPRAPLARPRLRRGSGLEPHPCARRAVRRGRAARRGRSAETAGGRRPHPASSPATPPRNAVRGATWWSPRPRPPSPCCAARGSRRAPTSTRSAPASPTGASSTTTRCATSSTSTRAPPPRSSPATSSSRSARSTPSSASSSPARSTPRAEEITVFKSLGLAVEDVAAASLVWRAHGGAYP